MDDIAPPLLAAGGALLSAGGAGAAGGAAAGAAASWLLLQAESTSAAAIALRTSFVFIDGSPELVCVRPMRRREKLANIDSIEYSRYFKPCFATHHPRAAPADGRVRKLLASCRTLPDVALKRPLPCACADESCPLPRARCPLNSSWLLSCGACGWVPRAPELQSPLHRPTASAPSVRNHRPVAACAESGYSHPAAP